MWFGVGSIGEREECLGIRIKLSFFKRGEWTGKNYGKFHSQSYCIFKSMYLTLTKSVQ